MSGVDPIDQIVNDETLSGIEQRQRIFDFLVAQPDRGVAAATDHLLATADERSADYVAQYLEMTPGARAEKQQAAERLRGHQELVRSAARLVPWLSDHLLHAFVTDYLAAGNPKSPVADVLFTIGIYRPDILRPYADRLDATVQRSLLSGAPDELADAFLEKWRADRDLSLLEALALMRTERAVHHIAAVREELADDSVWEVLLTLAGRLPDSGRSSGYGPAYMGFVVEGQAGPHVLGGTCHGGVPICPECEAPAEPLLTLRAGALDTDIENDATFFWYSCDCEALDSITVKIGPEGLTVYYGPEGPASEESVLVPGGEKSLVLEKHPNQVGVSEEALPGESLHQVGGLPRWVEIDRHPRCPSCGDMMPFLAAVGGGPTPYGDLGFEGYLYGFWCDRCRVSSTKFQS
jgi:hypothetical protein